MRASFEGDVSASVGRTIINDNDVFEGGENVVHRLADYGLLVITRDDNPNILKDFNQNEFPPTCFVSAMTITKSFARCKLSLKTQMKLW